MTDLEALDAAIQEAAVNGFASVTIGGQTTTMRTLKDLIEWRRELEKAQVATRTGFGLRMNRIEPHYR